LDANLVKDENKQAYRFIEKALQKGPILKAAPNENTQETRSGTYSSSQP